MVKWGMRLVSNDKWLLVDKILQTQLCFALNTTGILEEIFKHFKTTDALPNKTLSQ